MDHVTLALIDWLMKHNLPTDCVSITIKFNTEHDARMAERALLLDLEPNLRSRSTLSSFGQVETMNGIGLSLRGRCRRVRAENRLDSLLPD